MKNNETILHGEAMLFRSNIPTNAKKVITNNKFIIVAPSETTGNHHVVDVMDGVDFYEVENNGERTLYMNSTVPTNIRCVHPDRHNSIVIPAGTYEFGSQQEYDPFTARMEKVRD